MYSRSNKAFSLIELMVVVAIVAIIATVAVPIYRQYTVRTKVAQGFEMLNNILHIAELQYAKTGTANAVTLWAGQNVNQNGWALLNNAGPIFSMEFFASDFWGAPTGYKKGDVFAQAALSGLNGITGYVAPGPAPATIGTYSVIAMAMKEVNGIMVKKCGARDGNTYNVPMQYLPSGCTCTSVHGWYFSGTPC